MNRVLFRVDFGPGVGLGHVRRCLSLATALKSWDVESVFLSNGHGAPIHAHAREFQGESLDGILSWSKDDVEVALAVARRWHCKAIAVDSHEVDGRYLGALRRGGLLVIARDDLAAYPFPCQMVVNGNSNARELPYRSSSGDTRFLLGPEYAVLPPDFWELPTRVVRDEPRNVLVTLGGGDAHGAMPQVLMLLDRVPKDFTVTAILGPFVDDLDGMKTAAARASRRVEVVRGPASMRDFMLHADLAVSAAGQTLYELARVGCPTVAARMAANQEGQLRAFAAAGALCPGGSMEKDGDISAVPEGVARLLANAGARVAMSAAGQRLVDGAGARRVASAIAQQIGGRAS